MDDTRWLNAVEARIWRSFVEARARVVNELDRALKHDAGMSIDDYEVLVLLSEAPDHRLRMSALSDRLVHSQSRLTQRIDRLVRRGWVRREQCPEDQRGILAVLTPEGLETMGEIAPAHVARVRELLIDLVDPAEREMFADVLERVAAHARNRPG